MNFWCVSLIVILCKVCIHNQMQMPCTVQVRTHSCGFFTELLWNDVRSQNYPSFVKLNHWNRLDLPLGHLNVIYLQIDGQFWRWSPLSKHFFIKMHHSDSISSLDHSDPSKPSHRLTNGPKPSKTIESDGSKTKNHWTTIDGNGQTAKKHSMVMVASKTIENFQWSLQNHWNVQWFPVISGSADPQDKL